MGSARGARGAPPLQLRPRLPPLATTAGTERSGNGRAKNRERLRRRQRRRLRLRAAHWEPSQGLVEINNDNDTNTIHKHSNNFRTSFDDLSLVVTRDTVSSFEMNELRHCDWILPFSAKTQAKASYEHFYETLPTSYSPLFLMDGAFPLEVAIPSAASSSLLNRDSGRLGECEDDFGEGEEEEEEQGANHGGRGRQQGGGGAGGGGGNARRRNKVRGWNSME